MCVVFVWCVCVVCLCVFCVCSDFGYGSGRLGPYGGWQQPAIKQYEGDATKCNVVVFLFSSADLVFQWF